VAIVSIVISRIRWPPLRSGSSGLADHQQQIEPLRVAHTRARERLAAVLDVDEELGPVGRQRRVAEREQIEQQRGAGRAAREPARVRHQLLAMLDMEAPVRAESVLLLARQYCTSDRRSMHPVPCPCRCTRLSGA
jgi:hypothetical protein